MVNRRRWLDEPPVLEQHGRLTVLRDDLLEGGSKLRFLPFLVGDAEEVVYGGPFCGGAALAISVMAKEFGQRATLFYAARKQLHPRQQHVARNGANIVQISPGYLTVVQARARTYAAERPERFFLPLGFDHPAAVEPFLTFIASVRQLIGDPPEVWVTTGSGMLARCLGLGFPRSQIKAVAIGLASKHSAQQFTSNVSLIHYARDFAAISRAPCPFPSCPNYDLKAWEVATSMAAPGSFFWNVMGGET